MKNEFLVMDRAVDVILIDGAIRFETPTGGFTIKDPLNIASKLADICKHGAHSDNILSNFPINDERKAILELIELLKSRRVLQLDKPDRAKTDIDPTAHWLRYYAGSRTPKLPSFQCVGGGLLAKHLTQKLNDLGLSPYDEADTHNDTTRSCLIAAFDYYAVNELRELNAQAIKSQRPFMPVWTERHRLRWGPMVIPHATACFECLYHREEAASRRGQPKATMKAGHNHSVSPLVAGMASSLASLEVMRWALEAHMETDVGMAWDFDILTMNMNGSRVLRLPRCHVCGVARAQGSY